MVRRLFRILSGRSANPFYRWAFQLPAADNIWEPRPGWYVTLVHFRGGWRSWFVPPHMGHVKETEAPWREGRGLVIPVTLRMAVQVGRWAPGEPFDPSPELWDMIDAGSDIAIEMDAYVDPFDIRRLADLRVDQQEETSA